MIHTSNFWEYKGQLGVSIAASHPDIFRGETYRPLCPSWSLVKGLKNGLLTEEEYTREYLAYISQLDPNKVYSDLDGKVLLCWEKSGFCHRQLVVQWLNGFGYKAEEYIETTVEIWIPPDRERKEDSCLWCKYGNLRVTKAPVKLQCRCKESNKYLKWNKNPTKCTCEKWRYKYG